MKKISKEEYLSNLDFYQNEFQNGKIFIFPTDTIYGIGCSAFNENSINKIREIKRRDRKPLSIMVPDKSWIESNFKVSNFVKEYLEKLPGKFTFILETTSTELPYGEIAGSKKIGIRIPDIWFAENLNIPIIATSVNFSGEPSATSIENIPVEIQDQVDYMIDVGEINGKASAVIDLTSDKEVVLRK